MSQVSLETMEGHSTTRVWGRKDEEYIADFTLLSRRNLTDEEHQLFRFHYILGADWRLCCRRLNIDRGSFFHSIYRIQNKLGRVFAETVPYALYPVEDYFSLNSIGVKATVNPVQKVVPIKPPVRRKHISIPDQKAA